MQNYLNKLIIPLFFIAISVQAEFRAGISVKIVTPDPLLPISGGVGPSDPVNQSKGDLTVRALVLDDGEIRVAFVSTDFLGFPGVLGDKAREQIKSIPPENILIGATHTHSAPDCYGFPDEQGNTSADLPYLDFVCNKIAEAINDAVKQLEPVILKIATGKANGKIAYNSYADELYDPRCGIIQAITLKGETLATLVNYAIHPEVLGSGQKILSPDLIGPLYDRIEQKSGGIGIFMNGAQGGMVTADVRGTDGIDIQTWDECIRIGSLLADEALRIINDANQQIDPKIFCISKEISFPIDSDMIFSIIDQSPVLTGYYQKRAVNTRINLINIGDAQIVTIPGEALPNIGYYLKRNMKGQHNFLFGLTNDAFGYILTKVDWNSFKKYNYITRTSLGEMTGEIYIKEAIKLIEASPVVDKLNYP